MKENPIGNFQQAPKVEQPTNTQERMGNFEPSRDLTREDFVAFEGLLENTPKISDQDEKKTRWQVLQKMIVLDPEKKNELGYLEPDLDAIKWRAGRMNTEIEGRYIDELFGWKANSETVQTEIKRFGDRRAKARRGITSDVGEADARAMIYNALSLVTHHPEKADIIKFTDDEWNMMRDVVKSHEDPYNKLDLAAALFMLDRRIQRLSEASGA